MPPFRPAPLRFWTKVAVGKPTECWPWTGALDDDGYGNFWNGSRVVAAHRYSMLLACGEIPASKHVLHHCDNPRCVNPAHLFLGDPSVNARDRKTKGRGARFPGELNAKSKLTADQVSEIRRLWATRAAYRDPRVSRKSLSAMFECPVSTIDKIIYRQTWLETGA